MMSESCFLFVFVSADHSVCMCVCVTQRRFNAAVSLLCCASRADPTVDHMPSTVPSRRATHTQTDGHQQLRGRVFMDVFKLSKKYLCFSFLHLESY